MAPPVNDAFASRVAVTGTSGTTTGTTLEATVETGEPLQTALSAATIWYEWVCPSPAPASVTFDTVGSARDTELGAYTGDAVGALTLVVFNDTLAGNAAGESSITWVPTAGTSYKLQLGAHDGATAGAVTLNWSSVPRPANDPFSARIVLADLVGTVTGTTLDASVETGEPLQTAQTQATVWYEWTCPTPAPPKMVFDTLGSGRDTELAVYTGDAVGALTLVVFNDTLAGNVAGESRVEWAPVAGTVYKIQVAAHGATTGGFSLNRSTGNDTFESAALLSATGDISGSTLNATTAAGEPSQGTADVGSVWFKWVAPADAGTASFTVNAPTEQVLQVWSGGPALADLVGAGWSQGTSATVNLASVVPGATYWIEVGAVTAPGATFTAAPAPVTDPAVTETNVWVATETGADVPADTPVAADVAGIGVLRRVSETYLAPVLDAATGRPVNWKPTSTVDEEWGRVAITVGGVDVTKVRGVRTELDEMMLQEPFGEGPASLTVGGASRWDKGAAGFEWLAEEKNVDISRVDAAGVFVRSLWTGIVQSLEYGRAGWELGLEGTFAGPSGMFPHRPKLTELERDWGQSMTFGIRRAGQGAARRKAITEVVFGIKTRDRGSRSETLLEYVSRGLSMCQTAAGDQWTLARALDADGKPIKRKYEWRLKDRTTVHLTVYPGARGVRENLRRDLADVSRMIFGEGVDVDGARWRGTKLPNVGKETVPAYPGSPLVVGTTSDAVAVWQAEASSDGYRTGTLDALGSGTFGEIDADAARAIQERAGLPVTGDVDLATWNATWSNGDADLNLGGARFDPIAIDTRVEPFHYSSNGSVTARNPGHDKSVLPIGRFVSFGQNVSKKRAIASAKPELARAANASWRGTITLDGVDPPEMSRLDIREGMNVRVKFAYGEPLLHIAGVRWSRSGPSWAVTLDVDERARDLLSLTQLAERDRAARQDPARLAMAQLRRSAQVRDTPGVWDSEGGYGVLPERDVPATTWKVFVIAGGQYGSLARVIMRTAPATRFCLALFGASPGTAWLNEHFPTPLADQGDTDYRYWDRPGLVSALDARLFIEAWGEFKDRAGYSPGYETHPTSGKATGHPVTGKLDTATSTDYALALEPRMYVAVWAEAATKLKGVVRLLPNE